MPSITSAAAGKWSSQQSGVLVNLYYWIIIILRERREEIMHSCCLYCCVWPEASLVAARGYTIFVQCFPEAIVWLVYKGNYKHLFPIFITEQSVLHFLHGLFIYYLEITWKTHKPYIFTVVCLSSRTSVKTFLLCIQLSYSDSRVLLSISYKS